MNGADLFDLITDIGGRQVKAAIGIAFVIGVLLFRAPTMHVFNWLATQRAHEMVHQFDRLLKLPTGVTAAPSR